MYAFDLDQDLARVRKKTLYLLVQQRINHPLGPPAMRAGQSRGGSEQVADQRAISINAASLAAEVWTTEAGKRRVMVGITDQRKLEHLLARRRHRPATVVASGNAFESWNALPEKTDLLEISCHLFNSHLPNHNWHCWLVTACLARPLPIDFRVIPKIQRRDCDGDKV